MLRRILGLDRPRAPGYQVIGPLGRGGFSSVHKALRKADGETVALKILNHEGYKLARKLRKTKGTLWEGELMTQLDHPNVINVVEVGDRKKPWFIVMEYIESHTKDFIKPSRTEAAVQERLDILIQLARAVEYIHDQGYLHRDLCAGNVLVDADRKVKLIDFGLAAHQSLPMIEDWRAGTPSYMAPELIRTSRSSCATDIYSLGVLMYEFLTGTKPVSSDDSQEAMLKNLSAAVRPPRQRCEAISPELEAAVLKALAKEPGDRFADMKEFVHTIATLGIGGGPEIQLLPSGLDDGQTIETNEQSIMAWAHSPSGIESVEFHFSLDGKKWKRIGDRLHSRPGRENIFGVDWDASALAPGTKVLVRAAALDGAERTTSSEVIKAVVGTIRPPA